MPFQLESNYKSRGDQGQAIAKLIKSVEGGNRHQTLLGVTGSGKTFTVANVIRELDRPTLDHNLSVSPPQRGEEFFGLTASLLAILSSSVDLSVKSPMVDIQPYARYG